MGNEAEKEEGKTASHPLTANLLHTCYSGTANGVAVVLQSSCSGTAKQLQSYCKADCSVTAKRIAVALQKVYSNFAVDIQ